jgi:hypothetical protein
MSFVPMELGLPQMEQEKLIGRLVNEVINKLPQEKRKGYLLNPKPAFTLQGMLERVLETEGITKEMLDEQRVKLQLLQSMLSASDEALPALVKDNDAKIDASLFQMLGASAEATAASGNRAGVEKMVQLQNRLLELSSFGAQVRSRQAAQAAVSQELQALGQDLTSDKLLGLVQKETDDTRLSAYAALARPLMDYAFFEALTRRVDRAPEAERTQVAHVRDRLLEVTQQIDKAAQAQIEEANTLLQQLMQAPNLDEALQEHLEEIDDNFLTVLNMNLEAAQRARRTDLVAQFQRVNDAIMALMQASAPPEVRFVNELLQLPSMEAAEAELEKRRAEVNQQLVDTMGYIADSLRQNGQNDLAERVDQLRSTALGHLMKANWRK